MFFSFYLLACVSARWCFDFFSDFIFACLENSGVSAIGCFGYRRKLCTQGQVLSLVSFHQARLNQVWSGRIRSAHRPGQLRPRHIRSVPVMSSEVSVITEVRADNVGSNAPLNA